MRRSYLAVLTIPFLWATPAAAELATGKHGVVAADHPLASKVGIEVLKAGGDAIDAAVATALALGVTNPAGSGIGGGGFLLTWRADERKVRVIDFRETAPEALKEDSFTATGLGSEASRIGGLAVGIPGEVAGLFEAHKRWGKLPWKKAVMPAARLAKDGFPVGSHLASILDRFGAMLMLFPDLSKRFKNAAGEVLREGDAHKRPDLARTLKTIADKGRDGFYKGPVAAAIVKATSGAGGVLTLRDLERYQPTLRRALEGTYKGHQIHTMPPPSSGGAVILEVLAMLEARGDLPKAADDPRRAHMICEALKHAFADRAAHFGDTDFVDVPLDRLLDRARLATLAKGIDPPKTHPSKHYGMAAPPTDGGTSHFSIIDRWGNAVALTTTINTGFGSLVVAGATGVILNNEMDDFTTRPGEANAFGLIQSEKNSVAPGKRPLSSMSPTIVIKDGKPVIVAGASGGPRIITSTLFAILGVLDHGLDLGAAVARPRLHHQWLPDHVLLEEGAVKGGAKALEARGHKVKTGALSYGAVQAAGILPDGRRVGACDPRKHGEAAAY